MTLSITTNTPVNLGIWKSSYNGEDGYILTIAGNSVFLNDKQADEVGRYLLFDEPEETPEAGVEEELNQEDVPPPA